MSIRGDVIDGSQAKTSRRGLIYTCICGWIDLGHARPDGALVLWKQILGEGGVKSKDRRGFQVRYGQSMSKFGFAAGVSREYYVQYYLTKPQKEAVALAIFIEVSLRFEGLQASFPYRLLTDSGFSAEDLVSDLIGFYRAVRPEKDYIDPLRPVSKQAALTVWDTYGAVGANKNRSFGPLLFPCSECGGALNGPSCGKLPPQFLEITPAKKGEQFRDWSLGVD